MLRWSLLVSCFALVVSLSVPSSASAQSAPEDVIGAQIEAFLADDVSKAFQYAAPGIKRIFRTPENFGRMVQQGYPMVWRPAQVQYGPAETRGAAVLQQVYITDAAGRVFTLEYTMVPAGETWQIAGVAILEAAQVGA
ncbi:MAG: DUF4864 domain-containing protein [Pseudomonadota bacterium]